MSDLRNAADVGQYEADGITLADQLADDGDTVALEQMAKDAAELVAYIAEHQIGLAGINND